MENKLYPVSYNQWAGNSAGRKPDYERCCEEVSPSGVSSLTMFRQCNRKRGFGPDKAYCKQHDPEARKARQAERDRKYYAKANQDRYKWHGPEFFDVLEKIANGHNDPMTIAKEIIEKFKAGEYKT